MIEVVDPISECLITIDDWAFEGTMTDRYRQEGWLCFSNGSRSISFYDKHLQVYGKEKEELPYWLRIETKAKRSQVFKRMGVTYQDLAE